MVSEKKDNSLDNLIGQAMEGNLIARNELTACISPRLRSYIYRSVLDDNASDDILQETLIAVFNSITSLKNADAFWCWLFRIASNQVMNYFRAQSKNKRHQSFQDILIEKAASGDDPYGRLMTAELGDSVRQAISQLPARQRQTVALRCYENLSFKEIGSALAISEPHARVQFHRALETLRVALGKQGFSKSSLLLALVFFGKITAPAQAAEKITVTAATVSAGGGLMAIAAKGTGIALAHSVKLIITAMLAALATVGTLCYLNQRAFITSVVYTELGLDVVDRPDEALIPPALRRVDFVSASQVFLDNMNNNTRYKAKALYEQRVVFPQGPDGPMLRHMIRWSMDGKEPLCHWLQDGNAYYYYSVGDRKLYLTNDPVRMLILPTDKQEQVDFIYSQLGRDHRFTQERGFFFGRPKHSIDNRAEDYPGIETGYVYSSMRTENLTDDWPAQFSEIIDKRDQMHKRGWTYYNVSGELNGEPVFGFGRIPFAYNKYDTCSPWLVLTIGKNQYIDYPGNGPVAVKIDGKDSYWPGDSLYDGLGRPWSGFALVDSVCRDAAIEKLDFSIDLDIDTDGLVTLYVPVQDDEVKLVYDINRYDDLLRSIKIVQQDRILGKLRFHYLQDVAGRDTDYPEPLPAKLPAELKLENEPGFWLGTLIQTIGGQP